MKFTHLHVHSHYSLLDGMAKIDGLVDKAKELGMDSLALTDHGVLYGAVEFFKKAKKAGIKPIIGVEFYVAPEGRHLKRANLDKTRWHLIVLAKNEKGYKNLIQLVTKAHLEGFYYKPRVDKELLKKHSEGLIGLSACLQGEVPRAIVRKDFKAAEQAALEYKKIFGAGNFYLEMMPHFKLKEQLEVNKALKQLSQKTKIPLVVTNDVHYVEKDDAEAQEILMCIQTNHTIEDEKRLRMNGNFSLRSPEEMAEAFKDTPEAIANTEKIAKRCNLEISLGKLELPRFPLPKKETADGYLKKLCQIGLKKRYQKVTPEIKERLAHELGVIKKTGFASYFLIVHDFIAWSKKSGIVVGPGRGSVAGSIVAYLLDITNIDPLKYDIIFERFLNPDRISMPDIDLDFADVRRDEVIEYVTQKYGRDKVAQIITFGTMKARAVIRDVGRALGYPYKHCDQLAKMIPTFFSLEKSLKSVPELIAMSRTDDKTKRLLDLAKRLEGIVRHSSTHACGVVITKNSLDAYTPRQKGSKDDGSILTQYEMHAIEDLGLLKMDFLGLKNLTVIENTLKLIETFHNKKIDIEKIPLEDKKTFDLFQKANTVGVFQFESSGMKRYLQQLRPTKFEDVIAMVALFRPGPMEHIPEYIEAKHEPSKIRYIHPKMEPILKKTYGVIVYQDQVLEIARQLAGFTYGEADILRKAVGKKIKALLDEQADKMIQGMIKNDIDEQTAEKIWRFIKPFADYGFNKSHSTCYALIGYQTAYLKAHYTLEFMTSLMNSDRGDIDRIATFVNEAKKLEIKVLPPDINESLEHFTMVKPDYIRFGLATIKNVGQNVVEAIVKERKLNGDYVSISDFLNRMNPRDFNKRSLESLIKTGAFDQLEDRYYLLMNMERMLNYSREASKMRESNQVSLFGALEGEAQTFNLETSREPEFKKDDKMFWEKELLGIYVSGHPLNRYETLFKKTTSSIKGLNTAQVGQQVKIAGIINTIKRFITKTGKPMLFVEIEDLTGKMEALVFPTVLERNPAPWQEGKILVLSGKISDKDEQLKLLCNKAEEPKAL